MSIFGFIGDVVSLPLDVVSDASSAIQGKGTGYTKNRIKSIGEEIEDTFE